MSSKKIKVRSAGAGAKLARVLAQRRAGSRGSKVLVSGDSQDARTLREQALAEIELASSEVVGMFGPLVELQSRVDALEREGGGPELSGLRRQLESRTEKYNRLLSKIDRLQSKLGMPRVDDGDVEKILSSVNAKNEPTEGPMDAVPPGPWSADGKELTRDMVLETYQAIPDMVQVCSVYGASKATDDRRIDKALKVLKSCGLIEYNKDERVWAKL